MPRIEHTAIEFFHNDDPSVTPEEWKEQMEFIPDLLDVITEMLPIGHPETANVKAIAERIRKEEKWLSTFWKSASAQRGGS